MISSQSGWKIERVGRRLPPLLLAMCASTALAQNGVQVNVNSSGQDISGDAANEPTIAVNPLNPNNIVIGWRQFNTVNSSFRRAGWAYTFNRGATWTVGGTLPVPSGYPSNTQQTDPVLAVNSAGEFFYWSEAFDPVFGQFVYKSTNGGVSWGPAQPVETNVTSGDKCWIAIDRTGGIGAGNLYGGWNNFTQGGHCFVRSTNSGQTWTPPLRIADAGGTQWMLNFAVGPAGEVYAAWKNYDRDDILITKSINAQDPNATPTFDALGTGGRSGIDIRVDAANDPGFFNINPDGFNQIFVDVDRSTGARRGWVYVMWPDARNDASDIYLARSRDGGATWERGFRVNDDTLGNGATQWMAAMSVAPNGRIDVTWNDTRNDLSDPSPDSQLFYSFSVDGGDSWAPNRRLSGTFDTQIGWPSQSKIGDYNQIISDDEGVNVVYSATFNGGQDLWFQRVTPMVLSVGSLRAGQQGQFTITGAKPNQNTYLLYSLTGPGKTFVSQLNVTLTIANPVLAASRQSDSAGNVNWSLPVPANAAGRTVWFQAAQVENASNYDSEVVQ